MGSIWQCRSRLQQLRDAGRLAHAAGPSGSRACQGTSAIPLSPCRGIIVLQTLAVGLLGALLSIAAACAAASQTIWVCTLQLGLANWQLNKPQWPPGYLKTGTKSTPYIAL